VSSQGQRRQQEERVDQVRGHDQGAGEGGVVGDQLEADQAGADQGLGDQEDERPGGGRADRVAAREAAEGPYREREDELTVSTLFARGTISPLHSGQWLPQPAPEPVARTNAPQTMTSRL
jgi:hypothetical protein